MLRADHEPVLHHCDPATDSYRDMDGENLPPDISRPINPAFALLGLPYESCFFFVGRQIFILGDIITAQQAGKTSVADTKKLFSTCPHTLCPVTTTCYKGSLKELTLR